MRHSEIWKALLAMALATLLGSMLWGLGGAIGIATAEFSIFTPLEAFRLHFLYALFLSWPVVGLALALLGPALGRVIPKWNLSPVLSACGLGFLVGAALAVPITLVFGFENWLAAPTIGLLWGVPTALCGLFIWPRLQGSDEGV